MSWISFSALLEAVTGSTRELVFWANDVVVRTAIPSATSDVLCMLSDYNVDRIKLFSAAVAARACGSNRK